MIAVRFIQFTFATSLLSSTVIAQTNALKSNTSTANAAAVNNATPSTQAAAKTTSLSRQTSQPQAVQLLNQVLDQIVNGSAFDAKVRETVWTAGREVVGVGTYEQAGAGTGHFNLQVTMHDGDGKHRLQQISDGRLAWTRSEISGKVSLRRVDLGRLDEWVRGATEQLRISPRLLVGGWTEMLSTIQRDYTLRVDRATLKDEQVWVITADLRDSVRAKVLEESERSSWPELHPTRVRVAVRIKPESATGFGQWLPIRMEFWSDEGVASKTESKRAPRRLLTLIEIYSLRQIEPPPPQRFRFENQNADAEIVNDTERYIGFYGVRLSESQLRQLRR